MYELCIKSIMEQEMDTLKEIVLKFSYIRQLYFHLEESHFNYILTAITYQLLPRESSLVIQSSSIYLFFNRGQVINKQKENKAEMSNQKALKSAKERRGFFNDKQVTKRSKHNKQSTRYEISQHQSYFDYNGNNNIRSQQMIFTSKENKPSLILMLKLSQLPDYITQRIQEINHEKLKCLYNYPIFQSLERQVIKEHINRFQFKTYKFNQYLYHEIQTQQKIFFIKVGTVEVSNRLSCKTYVLDGKFMIGMNKQYRQRARSISQIIACYSISNSALLSMLNRRQAKANEIMSHFNTSFSNAFHSTSIQSQLMLEQSNISQNNLVFHKKTQTKQIFNPLNRANSEIFKKNMHRTQSAQQIQSKLSKRLKLRCHFSNFYNQVFNAYSQKKIQQMGLNMNEQQNLRLYEIKQMKKTMPVMNEIKQKLKRTKEYKLKRCKNRLQQEMQNQRLYGQSCLRIVQL